MEEKEYEEKLEDFVKKIMAVAVMACMLLTVTGVSSNEGIMPCGETEEIVFFL